MKLLRWIFGIPLAFGIVLGLIYIVIDSNSIAHFFGQHIKLDLAYHFVLACVLFFLLLFLSSLFVPAPKKYGAIITAVICYLIVLGLLYYLFFVATDGITIIFIASSSGLFSGILVGFLVSYWVFKNRGWSRAYSDPDITDVLEQY